MAVIGSNQQQTMGKRKEIYKYDAPWNVYAMNWSTRIDKKFRLALGSFIEEYNNKVCYGLWFKFLLTNFDFQVQIITLDEQNSEFASRATFDHPYPTTKIMWMPAENKLYLPDLLATSGDYLRIWRVLNESNSAVKLECLLNNVRLLQLLYILYLTNFFSLIIKQNKNSDFCAPLTSFDWNYCDPNILGTSSIDTTCTIWGIETGQVIGRTQPCLTGHVKTQLIAHDKEVFDIAFSEAGGGRDIFASVGADGSVRMFDLRHLEHSTIVYENAAPLLRLAWSRQNSYYLATFSSDSNEIVILDIRVPCTPTATLKNHRSYVNGISWAPHSNSHICTACKYTNLWLTILL